MAPELIIRISYDPNKMEVWALGICLYKLLTGKFPFTGKSDEELNRNLKEKVVNYPEYLSAEATELLQKMLWKEPFKRATTTEIIIDKWFYELIGHKKDTDCKRNPKKKEVSKLNRFAGKDFMMDKSVSKFSLDEKIVKNIAKLGYSEETILNEVEDEESYLGRLYRKLFDLKNSFK